MGAIFAFGSHATDIARASPDAVTHGLYFTYNVAAAMLTAALVSSVLSRALVRRSARRAQSG